MKKTALFLSIILMVLILSGCNDKNNETGGSNNLETGGAVQQTEENVADKNVGMEEGNILNKLKSSLTSGKKMKCVYKIESDGNATEIISYMQGEKYRSEIAMGAIKTKSIFDGDVMYSWVEGQKQGMKMTMDCMESLGNELNTPEDKNEEVLPKEGDEFVESLKDAKNLSCEDADDIDFSIPSDVEFTDQCEMLKSQQELLEKFKQ